MKKAVNLGFDVEIFSNGYWATCVENSIKWLTPMSKAKNVKISLSSDLYHAEKWISEEAKNAVKAANALNIKISIIAVKYPSVVAEDLKEVEDVKVDLWELMFRGGASSTLVDKANKKTWSEFTKCPYEDFTRQKKSSRRPLRICPCLSRNFNRQYL